MKIAILSRKSSLYSTNRLKEAGEARGHEMLIIDYLRCYMNITSRNPQVLYQGKPLEGIDAKMSEVSSQITLNLLQCDRLRQAAPSLPAAISA